MSVCLRVYPCVHCMSVFTINITRKSYIYRMQLFVYVLYVKLPLDHFMYMFNCMQFNMYVCLCVYICI
jgi:hypothetical protein